jgi:hypothetical protein
MTEKRKRGRPRIDTRSIEPAHLGEDLRSRHGKLNKHYMIEALVALKGLPDANTRWPWLLPEGMPPTGDVRRKAVWYELGRIGNPETIIWLADQLCTGQFTVTEVVRRIRAWKLDKPILAPADVEELRSGSSIPSLNTRRIRA